MKPIPCCPHCWYATAIFATVVLVLLAACAGPSSTGSRGCMRSHGVPNFPDPTTDSSGPVFNITNAGISDAASHTNQFEAKLDECSRLVGGNAPESFE
jgi:hypothetical protein